MVIGKASSRLGRTDQLRDLLGGPAGVLGLDGLGLAVILLDDLLGGRSLVGVGSAVALFAHDASLGLAQGLLGHAGLLLGRGVVPVAGDVEVVAEDVADLLEGAAFGLGEEEVDDDPVDGAGDDEDEVELPADLVEGHGGADQGDLAGQVEGRQAQGDAVGAEVVGEDLGHVDVLGGVDEEAPPEDVEPDEEDGRVEPGLVGGVEERRRQGTQEDQGGDATRRPDEHEEASAEAVNIEGSPGVADDGERGPACIEQERDRAAESQAGVDQDTTVEERKRRLVSKVGRQV